MENLAESSQIFEASSRLASAASAIKQLHTTKTVSESEKASLNWACGFLAQVDWTTTVPDHTPPASGFCVQATAVRPAFYSALISITRKLSRAGLNKESDLKEFLNQVFNLLGKECEKAARETPPERISLAATFLSDLSNYLLMQLTHNGIPMNTELLVACLR